LEKGQRTAELAADACLNISLRRKKKGQCDTWRMAAWSQAGQLFTWTHHPRRRAGGRGRPGRAPWWPLAWPGLHPAGCCLEARPRRVL
jgi:hypothetical protein